MDFFEKRYLSDLLKRHNGNISKAALEAQINRKTIHRLLKRHRLTEDQRAWIKIVGFWNIRGILCYADMKNVGTISLLLW